MMVKTQKKTHVTCLLAVVVCMSLSYAVYAGVGAEASNQSANSGYTATAAVSNLPAYPGMDANAAYLTSAQPAQYYPDIPQYLQQGTAASMYGSAMYAPYDAMSTMPGASANSMYAPYGQVPMMSGGESSGSMYAPYDAAATMPGSEFGSRAIVPQTNQGTGQYPLPYTMYPYDPYQVYGQSNPYQGYGQNPYQGYGQDPYQGYGQNPYQGYGNYNPYSYATADQTYNQAKQAYDSRDYWTAMTKFQEVAMRFPQSDLADNAYYWMGEIQYAWKNFPAAIQSFQTVLYSYPQGNKVPDAHVKMGFAYAEMRQYSMARSILQDVASRYQNNTRIRSLAVKKLNELNNR